MKMFAPVEAQPSDRIAYRINVFLLFFFRIGVVQAQMADAVIISRQTKVETDAFRMTDMQVAIRLGGKTGFDASSPFTAPVILFNVVADEVGSSSGRRVGINVICQVGLSNLQSRHYSSN